MHAISLAGKGSINQLIQTRAVHARPDPIRREVMHIYRVVLLPVNHRKGFRERASIGILEPLRVGRPCSKRTLMHSYEILYYFDDQVVGQPAQIALHRMPNPMAVPIVVDLELALLVTAVNVPCQQITDMSMFG